MKNGLLITVKQDYNEAFKWLKKSALQENADAQYLLGVMYFNGEGVKKDRSNAIRGYKKSAEKGNLKAQYELYELQNK